jgi:hypothetical protein
MDEKDMAVRIERLEELVGAVEDKAWAAGQDASAARFVLGNLLLALAADRVMDIAALMIRLRLAATRLPESRDQRAAEDFLRDVLQALQATPPAGSGTPGGGSPPPPVFH